MLIDLRNRYPELLLGYSDHTLPNEQMTSLVSAHLLGAVVLEKHFTLDRTMKGPDHPFAIEPNELRDMVQNIRLAEIMLKEKTGMTDSESGRKMWSALRSVVTSRPISAGSLIVSDDITTKRPMLKGAISAEDYYKIASGAFRAKRDLPADHILMREDVEK
jgi:N-acetylneuraminate synthase